MKICLLASGALGYETLKEIFQNEIITSVFTDKNSVDIITFCKENNITLFIGNPRKNEAFEFIKLVNCDLLLSVNYLYIIESNLIKSAKCAINIHGSLLPKYRGRAPHIWSIINGEIQTGITAHFITDELDGGDIIDQIIIPIDHKDTGFDILKKYELLYPVLIEKIIKSITENTLKQYSQNSDLATYFSKRTPEDGRINWDWHKERIYNWVRALAPPYPGAFAFYKEQKIIFSSSDFSDLGFNDQDANGKILYISENHLTIKSPNGAINLYLDKNQKNFNFQTGDKLN
jgi:methionyl-tRNA formyltransferase